MAKTLIERIAQALHIIPNLDREKVDSVDLPLRKFPDHEDWDDHMELDAQAWPKRVERNYSLVPTTCFNCESACGFWLMSIRRAVRSPSSKAIPAIRAAAGETVPKARRRLTRFRILSGFSTPCAARASAVEAGGRGLPGMRRWTRSQQRFAPH